MQEVPKALATAPASKDVWGTGLTASGMVRTLRDATMDNLQPIPTGSIEPTDAVQRLDGSGSGAVTIVLGLRYSLHVGQTVGAIMLLR